jgi:hypothetical protein
MMVRFGKPPSERVGRSPPDGLDRGRSPRRTRRWMALRITAGSPPVPARPGCLGAIRPAPRSGLAQRSRCPCAGPRGVFRLARRMRRPVPDRSETASRSARIARVPDRAAFSVSRGACVALCRTAALGLAQRVRRPVPDRVAFSVSRGACAAVYRTARRFPSRAARAPPWAGPLRKRAPRARRRHSLGTAARSVIRPRRWLARRGVSVAQSSTRRDGE